MKKLARGLETVTEVKWDYGIITWMIIVHVIAIVGGILTFSFGAFYTALILYFLTGCFGITFCFHRLLTHRSFKTYKWIERTAATFGVLALQGSPLEWVAHHRMHHARADTPGDPHSAARGFWHSHMGWLFKKVPEVDDAVYLRKFGRDILVDPYLRWISRPLVMVGLQVILGLSLIFLFGIGYGIWGIAVRLVAVYHVTWFVNSASHLWGYKNYSLPTLAFNNWWVGLLAYGEGWHNNHHAQPEGVHVSHRWWEFDLTWQIIKYMGFLGMAWDFKLPNVDHHRY